MRFFRSVFSSSFPHLTPDKKEEGCFWHFSTLPLLPISLPASSHIFSQKFGKLGDPASPPPPIKLHFLFSCLIAASFRAANRRTEKTFFLPCFPIFPRNFRTSNAQFPLHKNKNHPISLKAGTIACTGIYFPLFLPESQSVRGKEKIKESKEERNLIMWEEKERLLLLLLSRLTWPPPPPPLRRRRGRKKALDLDYALSIRGLQEKEGEDVHKLLFPCAKNKSGDQKCLRARLLHLTANIFWYIFLPHFPYTSFEDVLFLVNICVYGCCIDR